jgi:hypothetical protein
MSESGYHRSRSIPRNPSENLVRRRQTPTSGCLLAPRPSPMTRCDAP